jgi:hypothetical protein
MRTITSTLQDKNKVSSTTRFLCPSRYFVLHTSMIKSTSLSFSPKSNAMNHIFILQLFSNVNVTISANP